MIGSEDHTGEEGYWADALWALFPWSSSVVPEVTLRLAFSTSFLSAATASGYPQGQLAL